MIIMFLANTAMEWNLLENVQNIVGLLLCFYLLWYWQT